MCKPQTILGIAQVVMSRSSQLSQSSSAPTGRSHLMAALWYIFFVCGVRLGSKLGPSFESLQHYPTRSVTPEVKTVLTALTHSSWRDVKIECFLRTNRHSQCERLWTVRFVLIWARYIFRSVLDQSSVQWMVGPLGMNGPPYLLWSTGLL